MNPNPNPNSIPEPLPNPPQVAKLLDRLLEAAHSQHASLDRIFRDTDVLFNGNGLLNGLGVELVCETLKVPVSDQVRAPPGVTGPASLVALGQGEG